MISSVLILTESLLMMLFFLWENTFCRSGSMIPLGTFLPILSQYLSHILHPVTHGIHFGREPLVLLLMIEDKQSSGVRMETSQSLDMEAATVQEVMMHGWRDVIDLAIFSGTKHTVESWMIEFTQLLNAMMATSYWQEQVLVLTRPITIRRGSFALIRLEHWNGNSI